MREDMYMGWTKKQYEIAWRYFSDRNMVLDSTMGLQERADLLHEFAVELQTKWRKDFMSDPGTGPMQVYDPEIEHWRREAVRNMFVVFRVQYTR